MDDQFIIESSSRANQIFEERKEVIACAFKGKKYIIIKRENEMFGHLEMLMAQYTQNVQASQITDFNVEIVSQRSLDCENTETRKCSICLQDYVLNDKRTFLACCHCFHNDCITEWTRHKNECPICREAI